MIEHLVSSLNEFGIDGFEVRYTSPRAGDVSSNYADISKARRMLRWEARTGLEEGLRHTVEWFATSSAGNR